MCLLWAFFLVLVWVLFATWLFLLRPCLLRHGPGSAGALHVAHVAQVDFTRGPDQVLGLQDCLNPGWRSPLLSRDGSAGGSLGSFVVGSFIRNI